MKKLYVLQHAASEPLGIWHEELERWHVPFETVPLWQGGSLPSPEKTLAAIVMGGPMHVGDPNFPGLTQEIAYLRKLLDLEVHVLGVCLGSQLLAAALEAPVAPGPKPEIGYGTVTLTPTGAEDPLLSGFPMELPVFQWHQQGFEPPVLAERLAASADYPNQAFRYRRAWGFQFHLEVTAELVDQWAAAGEADLRRVPGLNRAKLAEQAQVHGQMVALYGRQVIRRFWDSVADF